MLEIGHAASLLAFLGSQHGFCLLAVKGNLRPLSAARLRGREHWRQEDPLRWLPRAGSELRTMTFVVRSSWKKASWQRAADARLRTPHCDVRNLRTDLDRRPRPVALPGRPHSLPIRGMGPKGGTFLHACLATRALWVARRLSYGAAVRPLILTACDRRETFGMAAGDTCAFVSWGGARECYIHTHRIRRDAAR